MKTFVYGGEYRKSEQELDRSFNNACVEQFSGKQQNKARPQRAGMGISCHCCRYGVDVLAAASNSDYFSS